MIWTPMKTLKWPRWVEPLMLAIYSAGPDATLITVETHMHMIVYQPLLYQSR